MSHGLSHSQLILVQIGRDHLRKFNLDSCADKSKIKEESKDTSRNVTLKLSCIKSTEAMI